MSNPMNAITSVDKWLKNNKIDKHYIQIFVYILYEKNIIFSIKLGVSNECTATK